MSKIHEHLAFSTSVFEIDLPGISEKIDTDSYTSGQTSGLQYKKEFKFLVDEFTSKCKEISENYFNINENYDYEIATMWLNKSDKYSFHPPHNHCNTFLSGVLMLDGVDGEFPSLELIRPQPMQILPTVKKYNSLNSNWFGLKTLKDKLYIFPSYLLHFVRLNMNDKVRKTIAFDVVARGVYYEDVDGEGKNIGKFKI